MSQPFLGEIKLFPWNWAPRGWALCVGSIISIQQNAPLYSLLGTYYGGNGTTTFGLPDLRGRTPIHQSSNYLMGEMAGTEGVNLMMSQMPMHSHTLTGTNASGSLTNPVSHLYANFGNATAYHFAADSLVNTTLSPTTISIAGGSQPHDNMQPFLVLNYCIATQGIFPARN